MNLRLGVENVYRLENKEEFWEKHQKPISWWWCFRRRLCLQNISEFTRRKAVRIMQYEPRNQPHLRYAISMGQLLTRDYGDSGKYTLKLCEGLGYDFNTVEFAVRDIPYAIDFGNLPRRRIDICRCWKLWMGSWRSAKWLSQLKNRNQVKWIWDFHERCGSLNNIISWNESAQTRLTRKSRVFVADWNENRKQIQKH
jgi:hypothetical protein